MGVSQRVREIENEIDDRIKKLPIWQGAKADVLSAVMRTYRDAIELVFLKGLYAEAIGGTRDDLGAVFANENRCRAGVLWALKWASEYCPLSAPHAVVSDEEMVDLMLLGQHYEVLVYGLRLANHDLMTIHVESSPFLVEILKRLMVV